MVYFLLTYQNRTIHRVFQLDVKKRGEQAAYAARSPRQCVN